MEKPIYKQNVWEKYAREDVNDHADRWFPVDGWPKDDKAKQVYDAAYDHQTMINLLEGPSDDSA